jgi:dTDP-4-amino-4,6-dideoxygalactose transaminase
MIALYPRHYLDISTRDLILAASGGFNACDAQRETRALESDIGPEALVTLSVRSAWDLILTAMDLPRGSEVIMSAVTIPDMALIAEAHGLTVIPIDLDPATMTPDADLYSRAFSPRTSLVVLAHLLGGSFDATPYARLAAAYGVPVIEDRAQAFTGRHDWGCPSAMATLFSFGSIKTCTALGGAIAIVRDPLLLESIRAIQNEMPVHEAQIFSRKARKYLGVQGFRSRVVYGAVAGVASRGESGLDGFISRTVKGFRAASPNALLEQLRFRPSGAQVALLRRRLDRFDGSRLSARTERGEVLQRELSMVCEVLGSAQPSRSHWLFAVIADNPRGLIARLRNAGFDATQGATTIGPLSAPHSHKDFEPHTIRDAMSRAVFIPTYPEMPSRDAARLVHTIFLHSIVGTGRQQLKAG